MKLLIPLLLLSSSVYAEFYVDLGIGWLSTLPAQVEIEAKDTILFSKRAQVEIDSPFLEIGIGYDYKKYHIELNRFGVLDDTNKSITTFKLNKRFK